MKIKNIWLVTLVAVLFVPAVSFAGNIGKNTYGILSENFSGATYDLAAPDDYVKMFIFSETFLIDTIYASSTTIPTPEGMKFIRTYTTTKTLGWSGWGICFSNSAAGAVQRDMQDYYEGNLKFVVRSTITAAGTMTVRIKVNSTEVFRTLTSMGFVADGTWQELTFPLSGGVITPTNLQKTDYLFMVIYPTNMSPDVKVDIDNIRWEKKTIPTMEVKMKDRDGNPYTGDLSFAVERGITKWQVADQYFEVMLNDLPMSSSATANGWIQIYTDNTNVSANPRYTGLIDADNSPSGLVDESATTVVLPMCWRVNPREPFTDDELVIYQNEGILTNTPAGTFRCYLWMQDVETIDKNTSQKIDFSTNTYARVWNHGEEATTNTANGRGIQYQEAIFAGYSVGLIDGRTPMFPIYLYIGGDFSSSVKVLKDHAYSTNMLTIELIYE
ncbi:MAG: hypothetical protein PHR82_07245 [Endomicrobiaceae bacterium]|nr:hypothetical protein [Endomicrobiaceae bacterium]